jgi:hypothetical protein
VFKHAIVRTPGMNFAQGLTVFLFGFEVLNRFSFGVE